MRHRKSGRKLKRTASHRRATLAALATSLLRHKRITTTVAKAKETRRVVERIITRAKNAKARQAGDASTVHDRRQVGRLIKDKEVVSDLFSTIAEKVAGRPGGYTRIVRLGQRKGDAAEMAVIELVDFNTGKDAAEKPEEKKKKEKQAGKPKKSRKSTDEPSEAAPAAEKKGAKKKDTSQASEAKPR